MSLQGRGVRVVWVSFSGVKKKKKKKGFYVMRWDNAHEANRR